MSTWTQILIVLFWILLILVVYTNVGYTVLIWVLSRIFGKKPNMTPIAEAELPTFSLLIAAHNEASCIEERIKNALKLDYPREKFEIVIASDGSSDGTAAIVRRYEDGHVKLLDYQENRGKSTVLNSAFAELTGDIVMLSDANTFNEPVALRNIARSFRDPNVGVVCGKLVLTDPSRGENVDSVYWKYESFLKRCESRLGALLGANGGIYAIRRKLFVPIEGNTIVDDFVIPLQAKLRTGCAIVYDTEAVAWEETPPDLGAEFNRRSRIGAGGFQCLRMVGQLLDPRHGWIAFTFFSHKVLRWFGPFFLLGLFIVNFMLRDIPLYRTILSLQIGFYIFSMASAFVPAWIKPLKPLRIAWMFIMMNVALFMGFFRWLKGGQKGTWKRTARAMEAQGAAR